VKSRIWDEEEEEGDFGMVLEGISTKFIFPLALHDMAHQYVIMNTTIMAPWLRLDLLL